MRRFTQTVLFFIIFFLLSSNSPQLVSAQTVQESWTTDGTVFTVTPGPNNTVYVGGNFQYIGPFTGGHVPVSKTTGERLASFPKVTDIGFSDPSVDVVISDGAGGWYLGGTFGQVGGTEIRNLAHILSDGTLDPDFNPNLEGRAYTLLLDGSWLYVGGNFDTIGSSTHRNLARINKTTGVVDASWTPDTSFAANDRVNTLAMVGTTLYVGGRFTTLDGSTRNNFGSVNIADGTVTSFAPNPNCCITQFLLEGTTLYVAGSFTNMLGSGRRGVVAIDTNTNTLTAWNPNGTVGFRANALALSGSTLYVGGSFNASVTVGGASRVDLVALDIGTGLATAFNANLDQEGSHGVNVLTVDGSTLYVGGRFYTVDGVNRNNIFSVNATTGALTSWDPNVGTWDNHEVWDIDVTGDTIYISGQFTSLNGDDRHSIAQIDSTTGTATSWNPNCPFCTIYAIEYNDTSVFIGGDIATINEYSAFRQNLAEVDINTATATSWDPAPDYYVHALELIDDTLYVGGRFNSIGGENRDYLAAVDVTTGSATSWNPGADDYVRTITSDDTKLYVGGDFLNLGGTARNYIGAFDLLSGNLSSWNPDSNGLIEDIDVDGDTVYAVGDFSEVGGLPRGSLVAIDSQTGIATSWNPTVAGWLEEVAIDGDTVYVVGSPNEINGEVRSLVGAIDKSTGELKEWNVGFDWDYLYTVAVDETYVYLGGDFELIDGQYNPNFTFVAKAPGGSTPDFPDDEDYDSPGTSSQPQSSSSSSSSTGSSTCEVSKPGTPNLYQVAWNRKAATLYFTPVAGIVTSYRISYGRSGDANEYTTSYTPSDISGALLYTVSELEQDVQYYFKVQAVNGCKSGEWSATLTTGEAQRGAAEIIVTPPVVRSPVIDQFSLSLTPTASVSASPSAITDKTPSPFTSMNEGIKGINGRIITAVENVIHSFPVPIQSLFLGINNISETSVAKGITTVAQTTAIGVGALIVLPKTGFDLVTSFTVLKDIPFYFIRMIFAVLELLGLRKRVKPWGVVFDSVTGQPIDPAVVTLFKKAGKASSQIGMRITDMAGRFGFLVESGSYSMLVKKTDYTFPSRILAGKYEFKDYKNLYFGQELSFTSKDLVAVNIPLDAVRENWNQKVKDQYYKQYQQFFKEGFVSKMMVAILFINLLVYVLYPSVFNLVMVLLSFVLFVIRKLFVHKKSWGVVYEKSTRKTLSDVTVRAVKNVAGKELSAGSVITDAAGRYYMLLSEGEQFLHVERFVDGTGKILKKIGPFKIKKETAYNPDISI